MARTTTPGSDLKSGCLSSREKGALEKGPNGPLSSTPVGASAEIKRWEGAERNRVATSVPEGPTKVHTFILTEFVFKHT